MIKGTLRFVIIASLIAGINDQAFAVHEKRIEELRSELRSVNGEYAKHQSEMNTLAQRSIMLQGAIEELMRQDSKQPEESKQKDK